MRLKQFPVIFRSWREYRLFQLTMKKELGYNEITKTKLDKPSAMVVNPINKTIFPIGEKMLSLWRGHPLYGAEIIRLKNCLKEKGEQVLIMNAIESANKQKEFTNKGIKLEKAWMGA